MNPNYCNIFLIVSFVCGRLSLLDLAAKQEHADALFDLGMCYRDGEGVIEDFDKVMLIYRENEIL